MTKAAQNLKTILLTQTALGGVIAAGVYYQWGFQHGASFAFGVALVMANSLLLIWIWGRFLAKKSFALTSVIIVGKYTVLLGAILILAQATWFHVLGVGLGMAAFIMSTLFQVALMKWE